jgi:hypothetical protein
MEVGDKLTRALPDNCCPALVTIISSELVGLPVTQAFRTVGAMILLSFGDVRPVQVVTSARNYQRQRGEWDLLIEAGRWRIRDGRNEINDETPNEAIDAALNSIVGLKVASFQLGDSGSLKIVLANGAQLEVEGSFLSEHISEWIIFRKEFWSLALEPSGTLVLEAKCVGQRSP